MEIIINAMETSYEKSMNNLFEAVSVGAALAYMDNGKINTVGIDEWLKDKELLKYITGATNSKPRVIGRIEFCRKKFEG